MIWRMPERWMLVVSLCTQCIRLWSSSFLCQVFVLVLRIHVGGWALRINDWMEEGVFVFAGAVGDLFWYRIENIIVSRIGSVGRMDGWMDRGRESSEGRIFCCSNKHHLISESTYCTTYHSLVHVFHLLVLFFSSSCLFYCYPVHAGGGHFVCLFGKYCWAFSETQFLFYYIYWKLNNNDFLIELEFHYSCAFNPSTRAGAALNIRKTIKCSAINKWAAIIIYSVR